MATVSKLSIPIDQPWSSVGWVGSGGYRYMRIDGKAVPVHRVLYKLGIGEIPDGDIVIFKNGDITDIRLENLELRDGLVARKERLLKAHANRGHSLVFKAKDGTLMKYCKGCKLELESSKFHFQGASQTYLRSHCRICRAAARRAATRSRKHRDSK